MREINWLQVLLFCICCALAFALGCVGWQLLGDDSATYDNMPSSEHRLPQHGELGEEQAL